MSALDLDAKALREIARAMQTRMMYIVNELRGDATGLEPLLRALLEISAQADAYDAAHPDDVCVWRLHGPDDEPSPILRIDTARGPVSLDVRAIVGDVWFEQSSHTGPMFAVRRHTDSGQRWLMFEADTEARAALDRVHAARVAHDDQHAEDRRTERLAEAVARGVAESCAPSCPRSGSSSWAWSTRSPRRRWVRRSPIPSNPTCRRGLPLAPRGR